MTSAPPPLMYRYAGEGTWEPSTKWVASRSDGHFTIGQLYPLVPHEERSMRAHSFFFARLNELWGTLHEDLAAEYPSPTILRRKALIWKGYCDIEEHVWATHEDAVQAATLVKRRDAYCIVAVSGRVLRVSTARSQSVQAMGKEEFNRSIQDVLGFCEELVAKNGR